MSESSDELISRTSQRTVGSASKRIGDRDTHRVRVSTPVKESKWPKVLKVAEF